MGKGSNTTTNQTQSTPDPNAYQAYLGLMQRAQGVASTPYQQYGGELVAGVNNQQNAGIGGVNQYAGAAQPAIGAAYGQAATSSAPLTQAGIQQYMNPYTQNVVDTTQAQFNSANAQQQQQVKGNAIAQGALGGNREAIAEAETARQQQLAQAPVIAGLYNQGYGQAVNTAQGQQAIGLQGAGMMGNLGVAGQTAGLQGAGAQIGAGTLQQNTQQALDAANYQQYQQAQAYPYQQAQWLAGLQTGVGSQMGGTSYGQTTAPPPNSTASWLGLGAAGIGAAGQAGLWSSLGSALPMLALSDVRDKYDIRSVGKTHDGQNIYSFKYRNDLSRTTHIGLIAQEVEHHKPHAVHDVAGHKMVDYDAATRARGGGVAGYDTGGGVAGMPWAGGVASSWIPQMNIAHGSGAPHASAPSVQSQPGAQQQAAQIGGLAKTLTDSMKGNGVAALPTGSGIPGAEGATSVNGAPLWDANVGSSSQPLPGLDPSDYGVGFARGGIAGFADGGVPDDDSTVINPDEPYRLAGSQAMDDWRKGVNNPAIAADIPENNSSAKLPVSHGVAPATSPSKMAFSGDPDAQSDLPSEVAQGYSSAPRGVAVSPPSQNEKGGVDWGANGKLWPALMSAGFGMMASRSPYLGVAIGEGGQAGMSTYGSEQQREAEAKKVADQMQLERDKFTAQYNQMTPYQKAQVQESQEAARRAAANQPVILGPDGKPAINDEYIKSHQQLQKDWQPKLTTIGYNVRGDPVQGIYDPNTKKATDINGRPVTIVNGVVQPAPDSPASDTAPAPLSTPDSPQSSMPSSPANASASATSQTPYQVASLGLVPPSHQQPANAVPFEPNKPVAPATLDNPNTPTPPPPPVPAPPPHEPNPSAPEGSDASRNTKMLADIAKQDTGYAAAIKKAADYDLDPSKYASMQKGHREHFINDVLRYDPNYRPQDVGLRYKAQAAFLPGTKTGDTVRSFNTAVSHLDTLREAYKAVENKDWQTFNALKNRFQAEFGYAPPNTLNAIAQIVGGEVVKATVGAQNALGDREELRKALEPKLSQGQALDVIDHFQQLMGGQLHSLKFAYEQGTGLHNFDEKYLLPRSREVLKHVDAEMKREGESRAGGNLSPQDKQALDWATANPNDTRAAAIKKKLGQ